MTDEKFVFVTDVRDKKRTARGSFNKRTHAGKGGSVKFPSDYLTRKELNAMNSEVKAYNINSPMTWKEFKAMPDDICQMYIKAIRVKFRVADSDIFKMLGTCQSNGQRLFSKLGLGQGKGNHRQNPDMDGWHKWIHGIKDTDAAEMTEVAEVTEELLPVAEPEQETVVPEEVVIVKPVVPVGGSMTLEGKAADALRTVEQLLQDTFVRISVTWETSW